MTIKGGIYTKFFSIPERDGALSTRGDWGKVVKEQGANHLRD